MTDPEDRLLAGMGSDELCSPISRNSDSGIEVSSGEGAARPAVPRTAVLSDEIARTSAQNDQMREELLALHEKLQMSVCGRFGSPTEDFHTPHEQMISPPPPPPPPPVLLTPMTNALTPPHRSHATPPVTPPTQPTSAASSVCIAVETGLPFPVVSPLTQPLSAPPPPQPQTSQPQELLPPQTSQPQELLPPQPQSSQPQELLPPQPQSSLSLRSQELPPQPPLQSQPPPPPPPQPPMVPLQQQQPQPIVPQPSPQLQQLSQPPPPPPLPVDQPSPATKPSPSPKPSVVRKAKAAGKPAPKRTASPRGGPPRVAQPRNESKLVLSRLSRPPSPKTPRVHSPARTTAAPPHPTPSPAPVAKRNHSVEIRTKVTSPRSPAASRHSPVAAPIASTPPRWSTNIGPDGPATTPQSQPVLVRKRYPRPTRQAVEGEGCWCVGKIKGSIRKLAVADTTVWCAEENGQLTIREKDGTVFGVLAPIGKAKVTAMLFIPGAAGLASIVLGYGDGAIVVLDATKGEQRASLSHAHRGAVTDLAVVGDGVFVSVSDDGTAGTWHGVSLQSQGMLPDDSRDPLGCVACTGSIIVAGGPSGVLKRWCAPYDKPPVSATHGAGLTGLCYATGHLWVSLAKGVGQCLAMVDPRTLREIRSFGGGVGYTHLLHCGSALWSFTGDGTIRVWNEQTLSLVHEVKAVGAVDVVCKVATAPMDFEVWAGGAGGVSHWRDGVQPTPVWCAAHLDRLHEALEEKEKTIQYERARATRAEGAHARAEASLLKLQGDAAESIKHSQKREEEMQGTGKKLRQVESEYSKLRSAVINAWHAATPPEKHRVAYRVGDLISCVDALSSSVEQSRKLSRELEGAKAKAREASQREAASGTFLASEVAQLQRELRLTAEELERVQSEKSNLESAMLLAEAPKQLRPATPSPTAELAAAQMQNELDEARANERRLEAALAEAEARLAPAEAATAHLAALTAERDAMLRRQHELEDEVRNMATLLDTANSAGKANSELLVETAAERDASIARQRELEGEVAGLKSLVQAADEARRHQPHNMTRAVDSLESRGRAALMGRYWTMWYVVWVRERRCRRVWRTRTCEALRKTAVISLVARHYYHWVMWLRAQQASAAPVPAVHTDEDLRDRVASLEKDKMRLTRMVEKLQEAQHRANEQLRAAAEQNERLEGYTM